MLFCPIGGYKEQKQKSYSGFLREVKTVKATIIINSLILSEFANRYLRLDYELWSRESVISVKSYKESYVGTEKYMNTVEEVRANIRRILTVCDKFPDNFNSVDIDSILKHFGDLDFNDSYYLELSVLNRWKIVSDDKDFIKYEGHNVEILTIL